MVVAPEVRVERKTLAVSIAFWADRFGRAPLENPERNVLASVLRKKVFEIMAVILTGLHMESDSATVANGLDSTPRVSGEVRFIPCHPSAPRRRRIQNA
jgi:hypothetical protein